MSYNPYRRYTTVDDPSADASLDGRNSNTNQENRSSPFGTFASDRIEADEPSPWSASSSGTGYDSLTLPPINPDNNFDQLPSFDDSQYFDALPRLASPNSFLPTRSTTISNTNSQSSSRISQHEQEPPPSNQQQARRAPPPISQYRLAGSESPDPFEDLDFIDLSPPPSEMPIRASLSIRQSSVVDLTESSPVLQNTMAPSRKRKATTSGDGRESKAAKTNPPKSSRSTPGPNTKKENSEEVQLVDLVDVENVTDYEALKAKQQAEMITKQNQEEAAKPVKLAEFQCIICMDNPTDLTVTFCGHLFCSECLHQALYAGDKKCCPVCRSNIAAPRPGGKQPKNGVFSLEMKFMTAKRKGKQAVR